MDKLNKIIMIIFKPHEQMISFIVGSVGFP